MGIDHGGHRGHRERLRELARVSERLVEFSVAWARRLKGLSPEARRRLGALRPQTRQTGGFLGRGADFRVYESFTPGRGRTVTKTLVPDALKERDEVMAGVKRAWEDVEASPAGKVAALPVGWHKAGYVQDRMVEVNSPTRAAGRRRTEPRESFVKKINPFTPTTQTDKGLAHRMPDGALDSSLFTRNYHGIFRGKHYAGLQGRTEIKAHNIMLDPRKRRLVLTDPLGWQSSSKAKGATDGARPWLTPGPGVR